MESINQIGGASHLFERRKEFGRWLRDCRRQAGITQADLATKLGYQTSQLISNIERGVSLLPSKRLPEFASVLGCSMLELEIRYFQCSSKTGAELKMPELLIKYLPVITALEDKQIEPNDVMSCVQRNNKATGAEVTG